MNIKYNLKNKKNYVIFFGILFSYFLVTILYINWDKIKPRSADINIISDYMFGNVQLDGYLQKDSSIGTKGNYILVINDQYHLLVEQQGLDYFVGKKVVVTGEVTGPTEKTGSNNVLELFTIKEAK